MDWVEYNSISNRLYYTIIDLPTAFTVLWGEKFQLSFWKHSPVGEEVNNLGGEYIAAVLWIESDKGSDGVKPSKSKTVTTKNVKREKQEISKGSHLISI